MLDLHCHLLPGVDDGAPDLATAVAMARILVKHGYTAVAPSPHFGEGPGGDVAIARAAEARATLARELAMQGVALELLANAEHHVTADLFTRAARGDVVPLGGSWLLVELPWSSIPDPEGVLFRLQAKGHHLLLAHPERYGYLELAQLERLVERGVRLQLELGSFCDVYGDRAEKRARALADRGLAHILATDLHRADRADEMLTAAKAAISKSYGPRAVERGAGSSPRALCAGAEPDAVPAFTEGA